jgi:hypothetical protein
MSIDFRTPLQIETEKLNKTIKVIIKNLCKKEYGFAPYKFTYGRKEKGVFVYLKEESKPVFLSIKEFKPIQRDKNKRHDWIKNMLISELQ